MINFGEEALQWLRGRGLGQIIAFALGVLTAYLGVFFRDRIEATRRRGESVRGLVTPAGPVQRALVQAQTQYEHTARVDPQRVPDLFRAQEELIPPDALTNLASALDRAISLPQSCLDRWRTAVDAVRDAQSHHASLRDLVGRSGFRARIVERRLEYSQLLRLAVDSLSDAAESTVRFAPSDARSRLTEITTRKG